MKKFRKIIAVILTVVLLSAYALPTTVFAAAEVADAQVVENEHETPEDFWDRLTKEDGSINWTEVPVALFNVTFFVKTVESIIGSLTTLFNQFFALISNLVPDLDESTPEVKVPDAPAAVA